MTEIREELRKAREAAQLFKEAAEAEKHATYTLGIEETQARLTEEFFAIARDYCDISWGKALDAVGIPADSGLRWPESIYYDPEIRELADPNSSLTEQAAQVSELPKVDQVPLAPLEVSVDSHQDTGKGKEAETFKGKGAKTKRRTPSTSPTLLSLNLSKLLTQKLPRLKLRLGFFLSFIAYILFLLCLLFFFFKEIYQLFVINEDIFLSSHMSL